MLVPSTLTGWYRKMIMSAEATTDTTRSRTQECITPLPCPDLCPPVLFSGLSALFSGFSPICPSISILSPDLPHLDVLTIGTQPPTGRQQEPSTRPPTQLTNSSGLPSIYHGRQHRLSPRPTYERSSSL